MTGAATPRQTYRRLLGFSRPYRGLMAFGFVGMALEAAASGAILKLLQPLVDDIFGPRLHVWLYPALLVGFLMLRGLFGLVGDYFVARAGRSVARDLRTQLFAKYLRLPGEGFDAEPVASMLTRLGADSDQVAQASVDALKVMVGNALGVIAALYVMFSQSWRVSLILLVLAPAMTWVMGKVGRRYRHLNHEIQSASAAALQAADQALHGQQDVKAFGGQQAEQARYGALAQRNLRLGMKVEVTRGTLSLFVQVLGAIGIAVMLVLSAREAAAGRLSAGGFLSLLTAMINMVPQLRQMTNVQSLLQRGISSAERLFVVLDGEDEPDAGTRTLTCTNGRLEFRQVSAHYAGRETPALDGVSFVAEPGTVTAIVGRSGSGKTTLVRLIARFYAPSSGQILLDGEPIEHYRLADLRRQIAIVAQQVTLFDGSIAANVAYGELSQSTSDAVHAALQGANASEFVERLPQGVASRVGERGGKLSGGQRQRIAIARAMLKDAPILILDEATAALDNESERLVQDALNRLMPERTTLVIAHRLSTIEHADQVLVMDQGRIVERGRHHELLALGGVYAHLHAMQFRESA